MAETLKPTLGLWRVTFYGLGTTIGAGIYALLGALAAEAGAFSPWSFIAAAGITLFTALSYGELVARRPSSAGQAVYLWQAFKHRIWGFLAALLVLAEAIIAGAAIAKGMVGYLSEYVPLDPMILTLVTILALGLLAAWGIEESMGVAAVFTVIEVGGLLAIIAVGVYATPDFLGRLPEVMPSEGAHFLGIAGGTLIAFFAYIGFETIVNVGEEVRDARRVLPRAIGLTLAITLLLYVALAVVAVLAIPLDVLTASPAPLAGLWQALTGSGWTIGLVGIIATANGALIMLIMGSRMLFGLAREGALPAALARVSVKTRTPLLATGAIVALVLVAALLLPIGELAGYASLIVLLLFSLMNAALIAIKLKKTEAEPGFRVPLWVPLVALIANLSFIGFELWQRLFA